MKFIPKNDSNIKTFDCLAYGDLFFDRDGSICMKINDYGDLNAVCLSGEDAGQTFIFDTTEKVKTLQADIVEK